MFVALDQDSPGLRPATSQISLSDWKILSRFWYPVAVDGSLKETPLTGKLLDVELVIYRAGGKVAVARDRCPHRYVRLSAGEIVNDRLVCPYHGLAFNADGRCMSVPSLGPDAKVPASYRLRSFRSEVRYGLVWACLDDESKETIPPYRGADEAGWDHIMFSAVRDWPGSAARQIENFCDIGHIPFVHAKTFGGDPGARLQRPQIEHTNEGFVSTVTYKMDSQEDLWTYFVTLPFAVEMYTQEVGAPRPYQKLAFFPCPMSAHESRVFGLRLSPEPNPIREPRPNRGDPVALEDIGTLSQLAEHDLPLDEKHEIHLPIDNVSLEYRRRLRDLGLGR